jgi:hypothetical protein
MKNYIKLLSAALLVAGTSIYASTASTPEDVVREMISNNVSSSNVTLANAGKFRGAFPKFTVNLANLKAVQSLLRAHEEAITTTQTTTPSAVDGMVAAGFEREMAESLANLSSATISKTANVLLTETKPIGDLLSANAALTEFAKLYSIDGTANKATLVNGHALVKVLSSVLANKDAIVKYAVAVALDDGSAVGLPAHANLAAYFPDADSVKKTFTGSLVNLAEAEYNKEIAAIEAASGVVYGTAGIFTNADMATSVAGLKAELAKSDALKAILAAFA